MEFGAIICKPKNPECNSCKIKKNVITLIVKNLKR